MAIIAHILHWSNQELSAMAMDELSEWYERAVALHNKLNQVEY